MKVNICEWELENSELVSKMHNAAAAAWKRGKFERGSGRGFPFDFVEHCSCEGREKQTVVADLDGTLLRGRSSFPYFMLVALEAGSLVRAVALMLVSPLVWLLYHFVSEAAGIQLLVFVSFVGLKLRDVESVARAVLPKFYAEDVHPESWNVFSSCGSKYVVTANPRVMVEFFSKTHLGADKVIGTELIVTKGGRITGIATSPGVLVGIRKRNAVKAEFSDKLPDLGIGDRITDYPFMSLCKESYLVPHKKVDAVPMCRLFRPVIFHDGRLVQRPSPGNALLILLWMPFGFVLAAIRIFVCATVPITWMPFLHKLFCVHITVKGNPPPCANGRGSVGVLFVCNHRTLLDPVILSAALGRDITAVTFSISRVTEFLAPIKTVRLTRDREKDATHIMNLLEKGDVVVCPEGTTCREPVLLRFSALFAELTDKIVPVAMNCKVGMFYGNTVRGFKGMDVFFYGMNPFPGYEITFLDQLPTEMTRSGGKTCYEVANYTQKIIAGALNFECSTFTRRDKYRMLAGSDRFLAAVKKEGK